MTTSENFVMIGWWEHSQKGVTDRQTDRRTDGQTDWTIHRAAWLQLKTSKPCITGLYEGNSPVTDGFPSQMASNAEIVSIWWRHHGYVAYSTFPELYPCLLQCVAIFIKVVISISFLVISLALEQYECHRTNKATMKDMKHLNLKI